jgi:hypothetical protein
MYQLLKCSPLPAMPHLIAVQYSGEKVSKVALNYDVPAVLLGPQ